MTRIVSSLYEQGSLQRFKRRHEAGETLFVESTRGTSLQSIFEISRMRFWSNTWMPTHIYMEIQELKLEGEIQHGHIDIGDFVWREDATESKKVRPKDRVKPVFMDKLGQAVEKGDLLVASRRDGSLEIGQFDRVTHKGTVFLHRVDNKEEFKLYQLAKTGEMNTGLLKLTRDLRDQIMLLKLMS